MPDSPNPERVTFDEAGELDEVVSRRGAHLERVDKNRWFLIFYHEDGTSSAFWFKSKNLRKPFWEKRDPPRPAPKDWIKVDAR